ncbi:hypothetical protein MGN70_012844 [Eutypa lata]|nr:hypothetical protein MGN70_012844 [Eutypa lata]
MHTITASLILGLSLLNRINAQGGVGVIGNGWTVSDPLGCYSGGLPFNELHGDSADDLHEEVVRDINTTCSLVDGTLLEPVQEWSYCSEWATQDGGVNSIQWVVANTGHGADDRTIYWAECNAAFNTELGGCSTGSEQIHGDWWYRIDPQSGPCP